jgi:8-oxo-dGTP pyrophosphatase MutT (NUDIX family)
MDFQMKNVQFDFRAIGLILREREGVRELLVHSFASDPILPWRFPGGRIEPGDASIESGLLREIKEESSLENLQIIRKLGEQRYFKSYSNRFIERHDFLLRLMGDCQDFWEHTVRGDGNDAGQVFLFQWIRPELVYRVDPEHHKFLDAMHIPEFFYESQ